MSEALLSAYKIVKKFGDKEVLSEINLTIQPGEVVAILGPSGSGKSTLLRCLNGLETITSGEIFFKNQQLLLTEKNWQKVRPEIGMVFQSYDLFPNKTVLENLKVGPVKVQNRKAAEVENEALEWLDRVGLRDRANDYPRQLSGGQKQRVAIVRSLVMNPSLMLFDEVTASLDPENVREVLEVILELAETDKTLLIVTHEMAFAKQVSDRIIFMADGEIVEEAATEEFFENPQTERAITFLRSLDFSKL
ncbi:amino acid ABC transporter ATP-binding protein [Enterococcus alishanensis]|uniref:Amino acid ABC transporter ATP-binding protein n=1 Tax=Enterococcus alishanensis TaxID=1303817 RepID=A0ABS6TDL1_9ENTE|nr:amino acid ABC transporter ATP-binding protein [Enterococcus alishanensis]MBV7390989.1 amino acid ABC transporter ATP-binding protein [Enterococcus alishanensis]